MGASLSGNVVPLQLEALLFRERKTGSCGLLLQFRFPILGLQIQHEAQYGQN